jgi:hypothetical protein
MKIQPTYLQSAKGKTVAIQLSVSQYQMLVDAQEELEAVKAFDKAMRGKPKFEPFAEVLAGIRKA